jgi:carboxyl-terminal processing protease
MKKSILTLAIAAAFLLAIPAATGAAEKKKAADTYRLLNLFGDVFERVRSSYVE